MSGPYQSNILRFLVGQYRIGLDRHRRAVMNTRSTVALGAEVGAVLAMTPVYAAVRLSRLARQKLRKALGKRRLPAAFSKAIGRLKSSKSEGLLGRRGLTIWPSNPQPYDGDEQVETVSLAERVRSRPVVKAIAGFFAKAVSIVHTAIGRVVPVESEKNIRQENYAVEITASPQSSNFLASETSSDQARGSLVWSMRSFWVALLEAVANLKTRWNARRLKSAFAALPNTASELPSSSELGQLSLDFVNAVPLPRGKAGGKLQTVSSSKIDLRAATNQSIEAQSIESQYLESQYLEAKVAAFEYTEHPLEMVLKWIDRILTWVESRWETLMKAWHRWVSGS